MKLMDDVQEYIDSASYLKPVSTSRRPISSNQLEFLSRVPNTSKTRPTSSSVAVVARRRPLPPIEAAGGDSVTKSTDSSSFLETTSGSTVPSVTPRRGAAANILSNSSENYFKSGNKPPIRLNSLDSSHSQRHYIIPDNNDEQEQDLPPAIQILNEFERQTSEFKDSSAPNSSRYSYSGRPTSSSKDILIRKHSGRLKSLENLLESRSNGDNKMNHHGKENKKSTKSGGGSYYSASSSQLVPNNNKKPEDAISVVSYAPSHQTEAADMSQLNGKRILLNDKPAQLPQSTSSSISTPTATATATAAAVKKPIPKIPIKQTSLTKPAVSKVTKPIVPVNRNTTTTNNNNNNNSAGARKYPLNHHVTDVKKSTAIARPPGFGSNGTINKVGAGAAKNVEQTNKKIEVPPPHPPPASSSDRVEQVKPSTTTSEIIKSELKPIEVERMEKKQQTPPPLQTPPSPPPVPAPPKPVVSQPAAVKSLSASSNRPAAAADRLDMYSNHLAFYDNKPSSAVSLISMISSHAATTNSQMKVIGEKSEPVVCQLFEDLPQPFSPMKHVDQRGGSSGSKSNSASKSKKLIKPKKSNVNLVRSKTVMNVSAKAKSGGDKSVKSGANKKKNEKKKDSAGKTNDYDVDDFEKDDGGSSAEENSSLSDAETQGNRRSKTSKSNSIIVDSSLSKFKSEPDLLNKSAISTIELNDMPPSNDPKPTARVDPHFLDKLFAIYHKYDNLLALQANKIASSGGSERETSSGDTVDNINKELSEQKAQFSSELERELVGSSNFEEMSSNPELVKRLKDMHEMILQKKISEDSSLVPSTAQSSSLIGDNDSLARKPPIYNNSPSGGKSNIRQVYAQVNNSMKSEQQREDDWSSVTLNFHKTLLSQEQQQESLSELKVHKIPTSLSEKINTIITPFMNASIVDHDEIVDDKKKMKFTPKPRFDVNMDSMGYDSNKSDSVDMENGGGGGSGERFDAFSPIGDGVDFDKETKFPWRRGNLLGHGAFGNVYQALLLNSGEIVAVKQIEMEETDPIKAQKEYESVKEEVRILRELEHLNIVKFWDTQLDGNVVSIFMEYIPGGTIENLVKQFGTFEEKLVQNFTHQICNGISYIHSKNVVHRDIKGKNIMLMSSGIIKLIDFGCAKRLKMNQNSNSIRTLLKSLKGTPYWMAPEVIRETGHGPKADIWSLGATVYEMATGTPPWSHLNPYAAMNILAISNEPAPGLPLDKFSPEAIDFVNKCLTREEKLRPSASELLNHKFLVEALKS